MNRTKIGNIEIRSQVSLAPMAGITDIVLRKLVRDFSKTCLITTEMISSEALVQKKDQKILLRDSEQSPISYQLSGHKPEMMAHSAKILEPMADIIDINMGCPVKKVVNGQDGSALMRNPNLAYDVVKAVKDAVSCPVSVKFRLGYTASEMNFVEYGIKMQEAGADFITIHGRTRAQMYSGNADWKLIKSLKENVDVPVFANGDVNSVDSAIACLEQSGADGVAVGRGILGNPDLIYRIETYLQTGEKISPLPLSEKIMLLKRHLDEEMELRGRLEGIKFVRKFYPYYINTVKNAAKYRSLLVVEEDYGKILNILNELSKHN